MPEEVLIIVVVAIIAGTFSSVVRQIFGYLQSRNSKPGASGASLTTSELQRLMRAAVEEGTASLEARLDGLEEKLERMQEPKLLPAGERPVHEDAPFEEARVASRATHLS